MALELGMEFLCGRDATQKVKDVALQGKFHVKVATSTGTVKRIRCSCDGCPFQVTLYRRQYAGVASQPWFIYSMSLAHVNCTSTRKPTTKQIADMTTVQSAVAANTKIRIKAITAEVQDNDAINLQDKTNQYKLYRARAQCREVILGKYTDSFHPIRPFLHAFAAANPGSVAVAEAHPSGHFRRACVIPCHLIAASHSNLRIVGVDGAHSHHSIYNGKQLLYIGLDGNGKTVTLAFALVEGETADDYVWFFSYIQSAGMLWDVPIFGDRSTGLLSSAQASWLHLIHCTIHIIRNVKARFKCFRDVHTSFIWALQGAATQTAFEKQTVALGAFQCYISGYDIVNVNGYSNDATLV